MKIKNRDIISLTQVLRKDPTKAEKILWDKLRNRKSGNLKFCRQYPIEVSWLGQDSFFVVDFVHRETGLVIEVDGAVHEKQKEYDEFRDDLLAGRGFYVIRFRNEDVLKNIPQVLSMIVNKIEELKIRRG